MEQIDVNDFDREETYSYRDETFRVRDNGAVLRCRRGSGRRRPLDEKWTFGNKNADGYMLIASLRVHQIVATAFLGPKPAEGYVIDHIDTNRCNNRPENLRWVTRLENLLLNPTSLQRIIFHYGSIEEFLASPATPKSGELQSNFGWMRTVTREEAEACLTRFQEMATSEGKPSGGSLGEWLFESRNKVYAANSGRSDVPSNLRQDQEVSEMRNKISEREAEIRAKVSVNLDRPPIRLPIIWRGMAQHVDYCPLEMRNYEGKPFANFIDDCLYSPCCASSEEEGNVHCIGGRSIKSPKEYEQWKARVEGRIDDTADATEEITREIDPPETLIEHKAARAIIRHMGAPASMEDICVTDDSYNYKGSELGRIINYPTLINIALTSLAYDAGEYSHEWDLTNMKGANYPDLDLARKFLGMEKNRNCRLGNDPETAEPGFLDVESALKVNFVKIAGTLVRRAEVVQGLAERLSQKGRLTEDELIKFLFKPENMKSFFSKRD